MVRVEVLARRIAKMEECLSLLEGYRTMPLAQFLANPEHYHSAERLLHLSIEAATDMGNHIIADMQLGHAEYGSQVPDILADRAGLPRDLADAWVKMIGLRNILVHDYMEIDHALVHKIIQNNLGDFTRLKAFFAQYL
ncbi:MAG: DUF86 domain-containing protein [Anaerolineales bacterium]